MTLLRACSTQELPPRKAVVVPYRRSGIAVFNADGTYYAISNSCPHMGAPLAAGAVTGTTTMTPEGCVGWVRDAEILACPWHRWEIELATGRTLTEPVQRIPTYPVIVRDEQIFIEVKE